MTLAQFNKLKSNIPETPGVYFFLGPRNKILYIGKAAVLRDRVRSYFSPDLRLGRGERIVQMVERVKSIDWRQTDSVLEALILESSLIKTHKPEYNIISKDDKSFNYVVITKEAFPRILLIRGKELSNSNSLATNKADASLVGSPTAAHVGAVFGPFPHGLQLRIALKIIRRIFPYRDEKCIPCTEQSRRPGRRLPDHGVGARKCKACFNRQIGLCPGVCTGEITAAEYARTIRHIKLFFQAKKKTLLRELEREMKKAAKEERFENASIYKRQIFALQHIQDVALIKDEYRSTEFPFEGLSGTSWPSNGTTNHPPNSFRIEAYDIAHMRGAAAYGVMTVVENGETIKNDYRLFRIRGAKAGDDPGALREVLSRRLAHSEWPMPRLIVADGATAQMNAAQKILESAGIKIPIVGVVKDEKHRPREVRTGEGASRNLIQQYERDIILANSEAHRFAISRHRKTLRSSLTRTRR